MIRSPARRGVLIAALAAGCVTDLGPADAATDTDPMRDTDPVPDTDPKPATTGEPTTTSGTNTTEPASTAAQTSAGETTGALGSTGEPAGDSGGAPPSMNLVQNGGFEDGNAPWQLNQGSITTANPHGGQRSLEYRQNEVNGAIDEVHNTVMGITPGVQYEISAWVAGTDLDGGNGVRIRYKWRDDGQDLAPSEILFSNDGTFGYTPSQAVATAPAGANELELVLIHYSGNGVSYIDDVAVRAL